MSRFWLVLAVLVAGCASNVSEQGTYGQSSERAVSVEADAPVVTVSDISGALAQFMGPEGDRLLLLPNRLDRSELDYSVESLKVIDKWLANVHTINKLQAGEGKAGEMLMMDGRGDNSVTFAGLYMGEVVRANSNLDWKWERFDLFLQANPYFAEHYGAEAGLDTFVLVGPQGVSTPINTALKRVVQGKEESVHYIATLLLDEVDLREALSGQDLMGFDRRDAGE